LNFSISFFLNEKLHEFRVNFNRQAISDLRNKLRDLDASSVTQEQVNIVVNEFGKIHIDSAKETFGTITKSNNRSKLRAKKVEKLHNLSFYRNFRKLNTGIGFRNRERLFPVLSIIKKGRSGDHKHTYFFFGPYF
jgi:hypothetical protein